MLKAWLFCTSAMISNLNLLVVLSDAYDALDPTGNITIKWDVINWTPDGYLVSICHHFPPYYKATACAGTCMHDTYSEENISFISVSISVKSATSLITGCMWYDTCFRMYCLMWSVQLFRSSFWSFWQFGLCFQVSWARAFARNCINLLIL